MNRAVHGYLGVNFDIGWDIVERDLPALARMARIKFTLSKAREGRGRDLVMSTNLNP